MCGRLLCGVVEIEVYGAIRWLCQFSPLALRKVFKRESFKHTSHIDFTQSHPKKAREKKGAHRAP